MNFKDKVIPKYLSDDKKVNKHAVNTRCSSIASSRKRIRADLHPLIVAATLHVIELGGDNAPCGDTTLIANVSAILTGSERNAMDAWLAAYTPVYVDNKTYKCAEGWQSAARWDVDAMLATHPMDFKAPTQESTPDERVTKSIKAYIVSSRKHNKEVTAADIAVKLSLIVNAALAAEFPATSEPVESETDVDNVAPALAAVG